MAYFEQSEWNNVRLQKQHERELLEKKIEQRRHFMNDSSSSPELSVSAYGMQKAELVGKLRSMFDRILPNLPDNEYIILIDRYSLVERGYPFDKQTIEDIVKYLQTYKKYMSMSMVDTKKLMEEQIDYQKLVQRDSVTTSVPDMLIPPSIPISHVSPSIQVTPIQSTPINTTATADTITPDSFYFSSTPISILNQSETPVQYSNATPITFVPSTTSLTTTTTATSTSTSTTPIRLHIEPVVSNAVNTANTSNTGENASSSKVNANTVNVPILSPNIQSHKSENDQKSSLTIEDITEKQIVEYIATPKINNEVVAMPTETISKEFGSPTSFTINYVTEKSIETDVSRPIFFTSFLCTDSLIRRYKLHTMPYVLLVINSKYKIPLYLSRNPNGYYEFHKRKGPFYASRVNIQLFDHVNEPIQFKNTPMELCHIQFETLID
jgi:hypothetical protein